MAWAVGGLRDGQRAGPGGLVDLDAAAVFLEQIIEAQDSDGVGGGLEALANELASDLRAGEVPPGFRAHSSAVRAGDS